MPPKPSCAIAVANSKGGTGKSTLIANLAVQAVHDKGRVALLDYDPQQSLARWWELRAEVLNPRLWKGGDGARVDVPELKAHGTEWIFMDLPPATMHLVEAGISAADFVLIPVKASPVDLEAVDPIIELCESFHKPFVFVLMMFDKGWKLSATAAPFLEEKAPGRVLKEYVSYKPCYVGSMAAGMTGPEYNGDKKQREAAADEIAALWKAIKKRALASMRVPAGE